MLFIISVRPQNIEYWMKGSYTHIMSVDISQIYRTLRRVCGACIFFSLLIRVLSDAAMVMAIAIARNARTQFNVYIYTAYDNRTNCNEHLGPRTCSIKDRKIHDVAISCMMNASIFISLCEGLGQKCPMNDDVTTTISINCSAAYNLKKKKKIFFHLLGIECCLVCNVLRSLSHLKFIHVSILALEIYFNDACCLILYTEIYQYYQDLTSNPYEVQHSVIAKSRKQKTASDQFHPFYLGFVAIFILNIF